MTETQFTTGPDLPTWTVLISDSDSEENGIPSRTPTPEPPVPEALVLAPATSRSNPNRSHPGMPVVTPPDGSHFPLLSDAGKAAVWPIAIYNWLYQLDNLSPHWGSLVQLWLNLEELDGFAGTRFLGAKTRPADVADWIGAGRPQNFRPFKNPNDDLRKQEEKLEAYVRAFWKWWRKLQSWRKVRRDDIRGHLELSSPPTHIQDPWGRIDITGVNGLTSALGALCIFALKIFQVPTPRKDDFIHFWLQAVKDVKFVFRELIAART
jgi:hypothetical protein